MTGLQGITTQDQMESLSEKDLRANVIMPLLPRLGVKGLYHNHGPNELGKDIIGWMPGAMDTQLPIAIVVKAGKISGKVAEEVANQANKAFNTSFMFGIDNTLRRAHYVWIMSSGPIPPMSKATIKATIGEDRSERLHWIDGDQLWQDWNKHFPVEIARVRKMLKVRAEALSDDAVTAREWIEPDRHGISVFVKDSSCLTEAHTNGSLQFRGDNSPESRKALDDLQRFFKTGEAVKISGKYLKLLLPQALDRLLKANESYSLPDELSEITLSPIDSQTGYPVRIEVRCEDGDYAELEYVDWRLLQGGTEQITFVNDQQPIPLKFKMVFDSLSSEAQYTWEIVDEPISATWTVRWMDLQRCLAKPSRIRIVSVSTGTTIVEGSQNTHTPPQYLPEDYEFFKEIEILEQVLHQPILVPETVAGDDYSTLALLRHLLRDPVVSQTWTDGTLGYEIEEEDPGLDVMLRGDEFLLKISYEETIQFNGTALNLGTVEQETTSAKLKDPEVVKAQVEAGSIGDKLRIVVVPGSNNRIKKTYLIFSDVRLTQDAQGKTGES